MKSPETILLLDGNALLHRAWHALPPLTTKDGKVVHAAYGFAMVLEKMLETQKPNYMAVAWDLAAPTFRHKLYKPYKAHREKKEQELYDQIPLIEEILAAFHIPSIGIEGYEGDDVIATLAEKAHEKGLLSLVVSGDLDLLQIVDDSTRVLFFQKGISETKTYDVQAVRDRFGLEPAQVSDYKALRGDPSDNIPGVAGIGEKSATELIKQFGSVEGILQALKNAEVPEKYAKKLSGAEQVLRDAHVLTQLVRTVPMRFDFEQAKIRPPDMHLLVDLYRKLEFRSLLRRHTQEVPPPPIANAPVHSAPAPSWKNAKMEELDTRLLAVLALEQPADLFGSTLSALAVSDGKLTCVSLNPTSATLDQIRQILSRAQGIVVHDLKHLMRLISIGADERVVDLHILSYLLHPGSRTHDLSSLAQFIEFPLPQIPTSMATSKEQQVLAQIVSSLPALVQVVQERLQAEGLEKIYADIERPLVPVLSEMERAGIELDAGALAQVSKRLLKDLTKMEKQIVELAGESFNVNSPQQLAHVLFEVLSLPTKGIKRTTTGWSTAAPELEKLQDAHAIIPLISEYREMNKIQSTYVETLPKLVAKDGRVHTTFNQTVTATGRLSSSDPNLQNIPIKSELGREIRKAFVAGRGKRLIAADYSQIELRLVAVLAKDEPFIRAFKEGADIHTRTASEVWGIPEEKVTQEQRRAAKAVNFGIIYGMGPRSLARSTGMSLDEARDFIDRYFGVHQAVRAYLDQTKLLAHEQGFVQTFFGRRRSLPEIHSGVHMLVAQAERMAINMPVQGTAADIMKMAMVAVHGWLAHTDWPASLLLQVHDELVLECPSEAVDGVARGVRDLMQGVASFEVPLIVDVKVGKNWGEMERWEGR